MNAQIQEYDVVRVVRLNTPTRNYDGTDRVKRAPKVGDEATVCAVYHPNNPMAPVIVEMVDSDGMTIWLANFSPDELEVVHRADLGK